MCLSVTGKRLNADEMKTNGLFVQEKVYPPVPTEPYPELESYIYESYRCKFNLSSFYVSTF